MSDPVNKKIKVVFGVNDFYVGGMQRQLSLLLKELQTKNFEITLITLFNDKSRENMYDLLPSHIVVKKLSFDSWRDVGEWFALYKLLKQIKPDVVISSLFFSNTVLRVLKIFCGYTSIAREHNTYTDKPFMHRVIDKLLSYLSYRIVAVSKTVAEFTSKQENIPLEKFVVIHNGIDTTAVENKLSELPSKDAIRAELGLSTDDICFLNISRLLPQKKHELLIRGFALFQKNYSGIKLLIVGDGSSRKYLENLSTELGVEEQIIFYGMRSDIWKFYKAADVFVSTSRIEGFSNVYLEAMASGLPLIATNTAGTDELLINGYNGWVIHTNNPEGVAEGLLNFYNSRDIESDVVKKSIAQFSIQNSAKKYTKLINLEK